MKAVVLATLISTAELRDAPPARKDHGRAERKRFTDADLADMFGDMEATSDAPAPAAPAEEPGFIPWRPDEAPIAA